MDANKKKLEKLEARCRRAWAATLADPSAPQAKRADARAALAMLDGMGEAEARSYASLSDEQRDLLARVRNASASPSARRATTTGCETSVAIYDAETARARLRELDALNGPR